MARIFLYEVAAVVFAEMVSAYDPSFGSDDEFGPANPNADMYQDIRLVSNEDQTEWTMNVGSADYDQWHGAACGASGWDTTTKPTKKLAREIARDLLDQVADQLHYVNVGRHHP